MSPVKNEGIPEPSVAYLGTDGYIGAKPKIVRQRFSQVSRDNPSIIMPFAQHEMVERFMDGIDPDYSLFLMTRFGALLAGSCLQVLEKYGSEKNKTNKIQQRIVAAAQRGMADHIARTREFQERYYSSPIMRMVSFLPKDELPNLAESLVELTSLKRHVSTDAETVGGPIDVALITKAEGFVWIKRKHYFKPELNPSFFANYRREL